MTILSPKDTIIEALKSLDEYDEHNPAISAAFIIETLDGVGYSIVRTSVLEALARC